MWNILGPLIVYSPTILFGLLFVISYAREPRQFRNAIWFTLFLMCLASTLLLQFGREWMVLPLVIVAVLAPVAAVVFLLVNTVVVVRHEGLSLSTLLPALLALAFVGWMFAQPLFLAVGMPEWVMALSSLIIFEGLWFFFTFVALLMYSTFYRLLPRRRRYDFIVIHGAGLMGVEPTPLLRGRIDKAVKLWRRQKGYCRLIASGGQGADEVISEAEAMRRYLTDRCGVPSDQVIMEDRSTTTMENLTFSKAIMDSLAGEGNYRCALVTSDYHVFRASEYAHNIGLKADGIGSHTAGYYWPTAFIREFIAITRAHLWPYVVIAALWAIPFVLVLLRLVFA